MNIFQTIRCLIGRHKLELTTNQSTLACCHCGKDFNIVHNSVEKREPDPKTCAICGIHDDMIHCIKHADYVCMDCCRDCGDRYHCDQDPTRNSSFSFGKDLEIAAAHIGLAKEPGEAYSYFRRRIIEACGGKIAQEIGRDE